jgi:hypothetical protein
MAVPARPEQRSQRLSQLPGVLAQAGYDAARLTYRKLWEGAVEHRYPAHQINLVWHFYPTDVSAIAEAYGLRRQGRRPAQQTAA